MTEFTPVDYELIALARQCKKFKVKHDERIKPGFYYRAYSGSNGILIDKVEIKGYAKIKKGYGKSSKKYHYKDISFGRKIEPKKYYFVIYFALFAHAYKMNSKVKNLMDRLKKATIFEHDVVFEKQPNTLEGFLKSIENAAYKRNSPYAMIFD
mgnify:CR=1 FL=1